MKKLNRVQTELLTELKNIYKNGLDTIQEKNKKAIGGLTNKEKAEYVSAYPDGEYVKGKRIKGLKYTTYLVLEKKGYIVRIFDGLYTVAI